MLIGERPSQGKQTKASQTKAVNKYVYGLLRDHFSGFEPDEIVTSVRTYPLWMRPDLQMAIDRIFQTEHQPIKTLGLHRQHSYEALEFPDLWEAGRNAVLVGPLQYIEVDLGETRPVKCLKNALWLLEEAGLRHAVILSEGGRLTQEMAMHIEIALPAGELGRALAEQYFSALDEAIAIGRSYRGKILSLESSEYNPGKSAGILVHRLHQVGRDDIVLPKATLELLERNVFGFLEQRAQLAKLNLPVKKGLLFYGAPGTGKTLCIHYLASRLKDHTTLLITAEQINLFQEYMSLARLLQPSIIVLEDADLIARARESHSSPWTEVLLHRLLNEMDGLREDAEILFILTTNRPETLEVALASRPGRIDQAIEFPLPDDVGRQKLVQLYAGGLEISETVMQTVVKRTEGVSAAFVKELMRRSAQFCISGQQDAKLNLDHVEMALEEILVTGGRLNSTLLGVGANVSP